MLCNVCNAQEATIHLTEIVNDQMIEVHLCEACADAKGTDFKTHFDLGDILTGLTELEKPGKSGEKKSTLKCADCGMTYDEFGKSGRLGCPSCYEAFSKMLLPLIKRIQRSLQHVGKRPSQAGPSPASNYDLKLLRERLRKSIQKEEFEEAARLRDEIKTLLEERNKKGKQAKDE